MNYKKMIASATAFITLISAIPVSTSVFSDSLITVSAAAENGKGISVGKNGLVTWEEVDGAESYMVCKVVNEQKYYSSKVKTTSYCLKNIPNEDYELYVIALTSDGKRISGEPISVKVEPVGTPSDVKVTDTGKVTWTAAENADHYRVVKVIDGKKYFGGSVSDTEYTFGNKPREDCEVYVTAYGENGNFAKSDKIQYKLPLGYVDNVTVKGDTVSWEDAHNALYYKVGKTVNGKTYYSGKITGTSYKINNLPQKDYQVFVTAFDKEGRVTFGKKHTVNIGEKSIDWNSIKQEMQKQADSMTSGEYDLKAFQFAVMEKGELVVSGTSGALEEQELTPDTAIGVASSSKMMATAAIMQLVDKGKVELDKPVTEYIPDFRMNDQRYKNITVRMLMNHSSGLLGNTCGYGAWRLDGFGNTDYHENFLEYLSTQRLNADPGKYSSYCNDGFTLLEFICENVSGMPYAEYLRKNILEPLGMEHTFSPLESFDTSIIAETGFANTGILPTVTSDAAQGGMFSTAEDLCRLGTAFTASGGVLSESTAKATMEKEYLRGVWCEDGCNTLNYGLGWDSADLYPFSELGIKAVTKNGDIGLSGSQFIVLPEYDIVAAAAATGAYNSASKNYLVYYLLRILMEKGIIEDMPQRPEVSVTKEEIPREIYEYEGTYIKASGAFDISFEDGKMIKTYLTDGDRIVYDYIGNGCFSNNGITVQWFTEKNGERYQVTRSWDSGNGLISLPTVTFQGVKTDKPKLSEEVKEAWRKRVGKTYLLVSEPADSFGYIYPSYGLSIPAYKLTLLADPDSFPFWKGMLITGKNTAESISQVPVFGSTNTVDAEFVQENGVEYLKLSSGMVYREAEGIEEFDGTVLEADGKAQWYRTTYNGKLKCEIPEGCAVAVYDKDLSLCGHTLIGGNDSIEVQNGGYIAVIRLKASEN